MKKKLTRSIDEDAYDDMGEIPHFLLHKRLLTEINKLFMIPDVIRSFACRETERLFQGIRSRKLPPDIQERAFIRLAQLDAAVNINDLRLPPSNRLEGRSGKRKGQWSIRINDQWRICFKFDADGAHEVEITDYH